MPNFVLASGLSFVSSRPLGFRNPSSIEDTKVARPPKAAQALPGPGRAKQAQIEGRLPDRKLAQWCSVPGAAPGSTAARGVARGGPGNPRCPRCTRCVARGALATQVSKVYKVCCSGGRWGSPGNPGVQGVQGVLLGGGAGVALATQVSKVYKVCCVVG